ncbi:hypothetical protein M758_3G082700 [Ceratodon purpureus]|nr:hypothetical protein M758_3G082700 [Ceratodon purpureus]
MKEAGHCGGCWSGPLGVWSCCARLDWLKTERVLCLRLGGAQETCIARSFRNSATVPNGVDRRRTGVDVSCLRRGLCPTLEVMFCGRMLDFELASFVPVEDF